MFKLEYRNGWVSFYSEKPSCWSPDNFVMRESLHLWKLYEFQFGEWVQIGGGF
jgi:hypothetical protein